MGLLTIGLSHIGTPVPLLERVALGPEAADKLAADAVSADHVTEAAVVATCNRVEVHASVDRFHSGVEALTEALSRHTGVGVAELTPHLAVAYEGAAVRHLFSVAAGLESVVVGEPQITGQIRIALRRGQDGETVGPVLNEVFQQALRVGRSVRATTGIDEAGQSMLGVALDLAGGVPAGARVVVLGAGSLAGMACATVRRRGAGSLVVANRSLDRARSTARVHGGVPLALSDTADLVRALRWADLVIACTGAPHVVLPASVLASARAGGEAQPLAVVDLALPHDVDPDVARLPGVRVVDLAAVADSGLGQLREEGITQARGLVEDEAVAFEARGHARAVQPAVVALRAMAAGVVDAELVRLDSRLPTLSQAERAEVARTVQRVVDKLLHRPTVRVRELAAGQGGLAYADALRELFSLDPATVDAMTSVLPVPLPPTAVTLPTTVTLPTAVRLPTSVDRS